MKTLQQSWEEFDGKRNRVSVPREAFAAGWNARQAEVDALRREVESLRVPLSPLELSGPDWTPADLSVAAWQSKPSKF